MKSRQSMLSWDFGWLWLKNSLKPNVISSWWAEGFIHTLNSSNSQIPLAATSTCYKKSVKWGNCRMWVSYTHSQTPKLQLLHCFSNLFVTCDKRQQTGGVPLQGTDQRAWWQSASHSRSSNSLPAEHWQFYVLILWCLLSQLCCSHRTLWKQIM